MTTPASERVRVRRGRKKGRYAIEAVTSVLDEGLFAYVAFVADGQPYCLPMLHARVGDEVVIHGSRGSRLMRALAEGAPACVTVTVVRGLVLARSAFEHSANYESVVALGRFRLIEDADAKLAALEAVIDRLVPGRWREVRPPNAKELRATLVLSMPLDEASAKVRSGPPDDDGSPDADLDVWAGVVPIETSFGAPLASPGLRPEIALAASVAGLQPAGPTELSGCGPSPAPSAPRRS